MIILMQKGGIVKIRVNDIFFFTLGIVNFEIDIVVNI